MKPLTNLIDECKEKSAKLPNELASQLWYACKSSFGGAGNEHEFLYEAIADLRLVSLSVEAPKGSMVLSVNDGLRELLSKPLPASVFSSLEPGLVEGDLVKRGSKLTVTVRWGEVRGLAGVVFAIVSKQAFYDRSSGAAAYMKSQLVSNDFSPLEEKGAGRHPAFSFFKVEGVVHEEDQLESAWLSFKAGYDAALSTCRSDCCEGKLKP